MKNLYVLSFVLMFFNIIFPQTHNCEITFVVNSAYVSDNEDIFIVGGDSVLGGWNPGLIQLEQINDSTWVRKFNFTFGKVIEYKLTKGSWENEALAEDGSIPGNSVFKVVNDSIINLVVKKWKTTEVRINHGQITGTVKYHLQFEGDSLKPRDIVVWLPPNYLKNTDNRYPVFYMHDGQNVFDPETSSFGYDWCADEVADSLIKAGAMNEILIVAIYNTEDRGSEYAYTSLGYAYMDFIVNKLKPFIDKEYRTLPDKENTAVCGASLGGLISLMMVWNYPEVFSKAACISSAFKISLLNYVDTVINTSTPKKDIKLYIDNGGIGLETELQPGTDEMIVALQNKGYELGKDLIWYVDKNAVHSEIAWAHRIWRPLVYFFKKK